VLTSFGDKNPQITLSRGVVLSQSTLHLVLSAIAELLVLVCNNFVLIFKQYVC